MRVTTTSPNLEMKTSALSGNWVPTTTMPLNGDTAILAKRLKKKEQRSWPW